MKTSIFKKMAFALPFVLMFSSMSFATGGDLGGETYDGSASKPYQISDADDLKAFAKLVNDGVQTGAYAVLTTDIDMNQGKTVLDGNGDLYNNGEGLETWTPIGTFKNSYDGTFDGNGHTIRGLYFNDESTDYVGLFGYIYGFAIVQNVGVVDSYFKGHGVVGGVVGINNRGTVSNVYNAGSVSGAANDVGGVVGYNTGTVSNVYNAGSVSGTAYVGGVVGYNDNGTVSNVYNTGSVSGSGDDVGGVVGFNDGTVSNGFFNTAYYSGNAISLGAGTADNVKGLSMTDLANLAIGSEDGFPLLEGETVSPFLTGSVDVNNAVCKFPYLQIFGEASQPQFNVVFITITNIDGGAELGTVAVNPNSKISLADVQVMENGEILSLYKDVEGVPTEWNFENDVVTENVTLKVKYIGVLKGVYQIASAQDLMNFASIVNGGKTDASAVLTQDIDMNQGKNVLNEDGTLSDDASNFAQWTPIGTDEHPYTGTFDGNGHTIRGLYFNDENTDYVGLFGYIGGYGSNAKVQNVGVVDSYFKGEYYVGGVVGKNDNGVVSNVYNTGSVSGNDEVGGVVGFNYYGTVSNVYNTGVVSGTENDVGGVVGCNFFGTVSNAYNTGSVSGSDLVGGVVGNNNGTVSNVYNTGSVSGGYSEVGGVVGYNDGGTVSNVYNTGSVNGTGGSVGGVVGYNVDGSVSNVYNTGSVSGDSEVGGVVGGNYSGGTVSNVYNTGSVNGTGGSVGGVVGGMDGGDINKAYYDNQTCNNCNSYGTGKPLAELATLTIGSKADADADFPLLEGEEESPWAKGIYYDKATGKLANSELPYLKSLPKPQDVEMEFNVKDNVIQISTAEDLKNFAKLVNEYDIRDVDAELTTSITLNSNLLGEGNKNVEENGNFDWNGYEKAHNWNEPESWSPIGTGENPYQGTFNGNNKTVSGVFNSDVSSEVGFFGRVGENGVVKNVGVVDSYINCNMYCGGIVGENDGSVSGVSYAGVVYGGEDVGGVIGKNNGGASVRNVYKTGAVYGSKQVGGIVGDNGASINNAFNMGTVSGSCNVGGVAGQNSGSVSKAYYNTDVTCENCAVVEGTTGKTAAELATINLAEAFPLQGSEMENPWANDISYDKATGKLTSTLPYLKNLPVVPDAETILSFTVASGVIQISTAEDLKNFAKLVNEYDIRDVDAELTTSITLNSNLLGENNANVKEDGTFDEDEYKKAHNGSAPESWTPIGYYDYDKNNSYDGVFNGNGNTVSGLYFNNESADCVGLFGAIGEYSKVQNVGVVDSYLRGKANVGGVVGFSYVGFVGNVYSTGFVRGSEFVGGVVGCNYGGFVGNVYSTGFVSGSESVGGVVGYIFDGGVENAYYNKDVFNGNAIGDALAFDWNEGGFGEPKDFEVPENVKGATSAEFTDGTVAKLLHDWCEMDGETCKEGGLNGSIWGQDLAAENSLPDFSGVVGFKYGSITFFNLNDGVADSASIDATAKAPVSIPKDITVSKHVTFKRPFAVGYSTMMLPFSVNAENKPAELEFYSFDKVEENNGKYTASYISVKGLNAHTPYIVKNSGKDALSQVTFEGEFTLGTSVMPPPNSSSSAWEFKGTYEYKSWEEGDEGLGKTYGFAGSAGNDPKIVGQFAKVGAGAYIYPMRAYLEYTAPAPAGRPAANDAAANTVVGAANTVASLPDEIDVVIVEKDETTGEQTTRVIGTLDTRTGEFKFANDRWFDLQGRYLGNKKPTQKGAYYNNGKKVIVK